MTEQTTDVTSLEIDDTDVTSTASSTETAEDVEQLGGTSTETETLEIDEPDDGTLEVDDEEKESEHELETEEEEGKEVVDETDGFDVAEFGRFLSDKDILPGLELGEDATLEDIGDAIHDRIDNGIKANTEDYLRDKPQEAVELFNHLQAGGSVQDFKKVYESSYSGIPEKSLDKNPSLQKQVMENYFKETTSWDPEYIKDHVEKLHDVDGGKQAKTFLKQLQGIELERKQELAYITQKNAEEAVARQAELEKKISEDIFNRDSYLGQSLDMEFKNRVSENVFTDKIYSKLNSNFENYRVTLAMLDEMGVFDDPEAFMERLNITKATPKTRSKYKIGRGKRKSGNVSSSKPNLDSIIEKNGL